MADHIQFTKRLDASTIGAAPTAIPIPATLFSSTPAVRVETVLLATDGTDTSSWHLGQLYRRTGGNYTEIGDTGNITSQSATEGATSWDVSLTVDGNGDVCIEVTGQEGKTIEWTVWIYVWAFDPN